AIPPAALMQAPMHSTFFDERRSGTDPSHPDPLFTGHVRAQAPSSTSSVRSSSVSKPSALFLRFLACHPVKRPYDSATQTGHPTRRKSCSHLGAPASSHCSSQAPRAP
ncbi:hypothetical protein FS749_001350, partial [Ceratobasidium sp. UAMH 11750]